MKLKYNISRKQLLWHHRRTIAAALAVLAAARIGYGYLTEGPPPELTLLRTALVHATPDLSKLPRYDIFASDKNVMLLENSGSERTSTYTYPSSSMSFFASSGDTRLTVIRHLRRVRAPLRVYSIGASTRSMAAAKSSGGGSRLTTR